ncbi:MAG: pantetheine-phosphate adenylyltransferase [Candidatus Bathyarchaeota archaeon]|nr:pantetheine-phosphate adenylyltransferase [Candidatus Bathyarchaeota archaeon]
MKKGIYAGSFDPPTNGHVWMIKQGARIFDALIIAIGTNLDKEYAFSLDARVEMLKSITKPYRNTTVDTFENQFLVNYARSVEAAYILRGIRSESDYEYERVMRHINSDLDPNIMTIFLIPPREIAGISSSFVKSLVGPKGWKKTIKKYVPQPVCEKFLEKFRKRTRSADRHRRTKKPT